MSNVGGAASCAIAVIGAGAAGLAAAIAAEEKRTSVDTDRFLLLDGARTLGAKILISGGGRCNVTHEAVAPTDFFGNRRIIKNILAAFSVDQAITWFASMGVDLRREETGKLFPVTNNARSVLNALLTRCRQSGLTIWSDHRVEAVERLTGAGFLVHHNHGTLRTKKLILATGGRSVPKSGSDGFGYELARRLGHHVTMTVPALVPLILADEMFHRKLAGSSQEVELTTAIAGKTVDRRTGSLLWTHFGVSGPVVMDASRFWCLANQTGQSVELYGNFLPDRTADQVERWLLTEAQAHPRRSLTRTLARILPERFAETLCTFTDCDPQKPLAQLPREHRHHLVQVATRFLIPVERARGWNYAEVTAGGVPLEEIDFRTMESKIVPGLYFAGEILDCDGRIGGFNFHWAWATGFLAGRGAVTSR